MRKVLVIAGLLALPGAASAEVTDYSAGKTPAQLFSGDCSSCHQSPRGLAKSRDQRGLADFLREHYTTRAENAGLLATYLLGNPGPASEPRNVTGRQPRGTPASAPAAAPAPKPATTEEDPFKRIMRPFIEQEPDEGSIAAPEPGEGSAQAAGKPKKPRTAAKPPTEPAARPPKDAAKEPPKEAAKPKKPEAPAEAAREAAKAEEAARETAAKEAAAKADAAKAEAAAKVRSYMTSGEQARPKDSAEPATPAGGSERPAGTPPG